jgi:lipopolysaccharide transport system ATP-binding protein
VKPILEIRNLSKRYSIAHERQAYLTIRDKLTGIFKRSEQEEEFWALNDVSFDVMPGESVGIIGRNGAGKSTLLKILSRITPPTNGSIMARGRVASLLEVGTGFHQELTGRENIFMNGSILGMKKAEIRSKFDEIVDFSGVEKFLDTPLKNYSSGMQLRLAFAVAAHLEPEVLIVDEVLAVGDSEFQKKCLGKMKSVSSNGATILFVSHNMDAIAQLCSRAIVLDKGMVALNASHTSKAIAFYLSSGTTGGEKTLQQFDIKNEYHSITQFGLIDEVGNAAASIIHYSSEITVTVEGEVFESHPNLNIGYVVYSADGAMLFWSYYREDDMMQQLLNKTGRFKLSTKIPARFLNEGSYRIELVSCIHNQRWLLEPGTGLPIHFEVAEGFRNVIFTPKFEWFNTQA